MVPDSPNKIEALLPQRYPQKDLFICDVADAVLKDIMQEMEHPFYSLSKKPQTTIQKYEHNGNWLKIIPSVMGQATIYDKDILIYCISQIMHKLRAGEPVSSRVRINSRDLLIFTNRGTGGKDYTALSEALLRLGGTQISTNIRTGDREQFSAFNLIQSSSILRKHGSDGRLLYCDVSLSDWVFNAIRLEEVLTLHPDYFRLRKPIERRIYELARKHCGSQPKWPISLEKLLKKTGSRNSSLKRFRQSVKLLACDDHLPDYKVIFDSERDVVSFLNRNKIKRSAPPGTEFPILRSETYAKAKIIAPGWDVYFLEQEWRDYWLETGQPKLKSPDATFLGFCTHRQEKGFDL